MAGLTLEQINASTERIVEAAMRRQSEQLTEQLTGQFSEVLRDMMDHINRRFDGIERQLNELIDANRAAHLRLDNHGGRLVALERHTGVGE